MIHNTQKILAILQEGLQREKSILSAGYNEPYHEGFVKDKIALAKQEGIISGIELTISWIENNITSN